MISEEENEALADRASTAQDAWSYGQHNFEDNMVLKAYHTSSLVRWGPLSMVYESEREFKRVGIS